MDRKLKGRIAEAKVIAYFTEAAYEVFVPLHDCGKYDLLAVKDGKVYKTSVKYTAQKTTTGKWSVELRTMSRRNAGKMKVDKFVAADFDILAVYIGPEDRVVLVDTNFTNVSGICVE